MPRPRSPHRKALASEASDGFNRAVDLVAATGFYAGIGYLLDRWLGTWPVIFVIGAVVGNLTGIYIVYKRTGLAHDQQVAQNRAAGVSRSWPAPHAAPASTKAGTQDSAATSGDGDR